MLHDPGKSFRQLLAQDGIIMLPGIYDGISARVAEQAGFQALYVSGAGASVSGIGQADIGLTTMTDVLQVARTAAINAGVPVACDCDTGYGNALNVIRTVHEFEAAGVAAIQIEDQVAPKRCGHLDGKACIDAKEFAAKIRAAANERFYKDTVIIARTDARAVYNLDEAMDRVKRYRDAGADVVFVEAPQSMGEIEKIGATLGKDCPLLINQVIGGKTPRLSAKEAEQLGYKIILFPDAMPYGASVLLRGICDRILAEGDSWDAIPGATDSRDLFVTMGMKQWRALEQKYKD